MKTIEEFQKFIDENKAIKEINILMDRYYDSIGITLIEANGRIIGSNGNSLESVLFNAKNIYEVWKDSPESSLATGRVSSFDSKTRATEGVSGQISRDKSYFLTKIADNFKLGISKSIFNDDYDWQNAFEASEVNLSDVAFIYAYADGENDGMSWLCIGRMLDGRFFFLNAWCDYAGWDCQSGGEAFFDESLEKLINMQVPEHEISRFSYE